MGFCQNTDSVTDGHRGIKCTRSRQCLDGCEEFHNRLQHFQANPSYNAMESGFILFDRNFAMRGSPIS